MTIVQEHGFAIVSVIYIVGIQSLQNDEVNTAIARDVAITETASGK